MSNYRLTITKGSFFFSQNYIDLKRWHWRLERKDGTIGYTDNGYTYTKLGACLSARYKLWKNNRPIKKKEYDL